MRLFKIFFLFIFFFLITENTFCSFDYNGLTNEEKDCYDLIKKEENKFDFSKTIDSSKKDIPYDYINGVILSDQKLFNKKSYYYGKKSQINIEELFPTLKIYGVENKENLYSSDLSFFNINKENNNTFLYCSFTKNKAISTKIENIKNLDLTSTYTTFPTEIKLENINYNNKEWKKLIIKNSYRNRDGSKIILESEKTIFIPKNEDLVGYYDLFNYIEKYYNISIGYKDKINLYINGINGKDNTFPKEFQLKEIYNNNGIKIERNYVNGEEGTDMFGIQYIFVNNKNFYNNFSKTLRYNLFSFLVSEESPLAEKINFLKNENISGEWWVLFSLGYEDENKNFQIVPYYTEIENYINDSYFKVKSKQSIGSDINLSKEAYKDYIINTLFTNKVRNNKEVFLDTIYKYEKFINLYPKINLDSSTIDEKKEFIKLYGELFPKNNIFKDNDKIQKLLNEPEIKKIYENIYNINLKTIIIIGSIIFLLLIGGFIYYKRNY